MAAECQVNSEPQKKRTWTEIVCPHCSDTVTKTTFYRHKRQFYNAKTRRWTTMGEGGQPQTKLTSTTASIDDDSESSDCGTLDDGSMEADSFVPSPASNSRGPSSE